MSVCSSHTIGTNASHSFRLRTASTNRSSWQRCCAGNILSSSSSRRKLQSANAETLLPSNRLRWERQTNRLPDPQRQLHNLNVSLPVSCSYDSEWAQIIARLRRHAGPLQNPGQPVVMPVDPWDANVLLKRFQGFCDLGIRRFTDDHWSCFTSGSGNAANSSAAASVLCCSYMA